MSVDFFAGDLDIANTGTHWQVQQVYRYHGVVGVSITQAQRGFAGFMGYTEHAQCDPRGGGGTRRDHSPRPTHAVVETGAACCCSDTTLPDSIQLNRPTLLYKLPLHCTGGI